MSIYKASSSKISYPKSIKERLQIQGLTATDEMVRSGAGTDVIKGLTATPKTLTPCYFYDDLGSELFEQICELPEYYVTRTETKILQQCAGEIARITGPCELVELGSGSSTKTRIILDAYQQLGYPMVYVPIDVSAGILESSARQLLADYPSLEVHALAGTYELALGKILPSQLPSRIIVFIGSTLGNLHPEECNVFLSEITNSLQVGEYFLLGIDLQKPKHILEPAYNDSQGVTATFNLNILTHLNRRFDGNFDTTQFEHWAFYNETDHQIEMHLRSLQWQTVELGALNVQVNFAPGETIRTEISRKFQLNTMTQQLTAQGLVPLQVWTDANEWFGLLLCQLQG
ncbi:L-histidine N(alpha)-methyltransferase [Umezakia ovalisporum]|jgi:dimethylhistidine N-methyltransferase|uniref:L-histidine N(Alpha)-methyltransferase n=1 Tax=Umezakia ovalisporum FSS-43 TaxID=2740520 RepID=A0ABT6K7D0_9CYAN|nr:L-histidine N(alpha)-methyltransferase [Umezakia ovalisporum]MBI1240516.1 L-histidine N(alpha)-methyltransferase [Nostoc sp. RI_552]MDH6058288.1 L-histidine N(alpha)-methyltransferase [Umezakia ovalisporum FSS-43]MDH6066584.1 L-histidine N(alpha)-methyltransferase [Umezakia ovalisporum APH033B]MDH6071377.1 L-histidine N(alpha)-methyltransferase [Umezakia ovalisporum CobakiLakeA]MDH6072858.1 L-histidine N(alpha)-methyltransferase [Umezakia ovalisporum CS-1034]